MKAIINKADVVSQIEQINQKKEAQNEQQKGIFVKLMEGIQEIDSDMIGFEELASLLALEDEHFAIIAPVFLEELAKSLNNANDKVNLRMAMNAIGLNTDDLIEDYQQIIDSIEKEMTNTISQQKIDFVKQLLSLTYNAIAETEGISKKIISIPISFCHPDAKMPTYANLTDVGMDIYAVEDVTINPGETKVISTGLKVAIPNGYELQIRPKSGWCAKTKLRIGNAPATIDPGYRGEIKIIVDNIDPFIREAELREDGSLCGILFGSSYTIHKGERFAQLVLNETPKINFYKIEDINSIEGDRGGGLGSTGLK